jgi:tetratricopeptide (TPR) repeat protein
MRRVSTKVLFWGLASLFFVSKLPAQKESFDQYFETAKAAEKEGRFPEAEEKYKTALSLAEKFKRKDPRLFYVQSGLAYFYEAQNQTAEAEEYYRESLNTIVYLSKHSDDPAFRPNRYLLLSGHQEHMGDFNFSLKKVSEATEYYRQALVSADMASKDHPNPRSNDEWIGVMLGMLAQANGMTADVARLNEKLALAYVEAGKLQEAEALDQQAAQERRKRRPELFDKDEQAKINQALAKLREKNYTEALALHEQLLKDAERSHGPGDPRVASILNDLGITLSLSGNYPEAEAMFQRSLRVYEHACGPNSPSSIATLQNYSRMLRIEGRTEEADRFAAEARAIQQPAAPGPPH